MSYAYDTPYAGAKLRPCTIYRKSPTSYAPEGVEVYWTDLDINTHSWVSRAGWHSRVYSNEEAANMPTIRPRKS